jgi:hypothetical protein
MKIIQITEEVKEKAIKNAFNISQYFYTVKRKQEEAVFNNIIKSFKILREAEDFKNFESILESIEIISDAQAFNSIQMALKQYNEKKLIPLEDIKKEFNL